jgi:hypothetical protein
LAVVAGSLGGCGGSAEKPGGGAGTGGGAGASGATGSAGATGATGSAGTTGGLPACAISTRPQDPKNPDGGSIDVMTRTCNAIAITSATTSVASECVITADGGVVLDGGALEVPSGGTLLDGDYEFVRWQNYPGANAPGCAVFSSTTSSRAFRVFGGGTYIEWAITEAHRGPDGGEGDYWFDTTMTASGHTLTFASYDCGGGLNMRSWGYTASGNDLVLFDFTGQADGVGALDSIDTYRRACTR